MERHCDTNLVDAMILSTCGLSKCVVNLIREAGGVGRDSWDHLLWLREEVDRMIVQASGRVARPNQHPQPGAAHYAPPNHAGSGTDPAPG